MSQWRTVKTKEDWDIVEEAQKREYLIEEGGGYFDKIETWRHPTGILVRLERFPNDETDFVEVLTIQSPPLQE